MPCKNHPLVDTGLQQCWVCGETFCGDCLAELQGHMMCAPCKTEAVARLEMGQAAAPGPGEKAPWERRAELGVVAAWMQTVRAVMTSPSTFFERLDKTVTTFECLLVSIINNLLVAISGWIVQLLFVGAVTAAAGSRNPMFAMVQGGFGFIGVILSPIFTLIGIYVGAGLTHLFLVVTKNAKEPFHQTMRGFCYGNCPSIVGVIPFVGPMIGGIWALVAYITMVMKVHKTSGGVAALSVLWWILIGACCFVIATFTVFATVMANHAK